MSREERLTQFLESLNKEFKAHNTQESFVKSMEKIDQYKTENARSAKARQDAASQFRIKFDALPSMPLSQTKVEQAKFPELATDWGEQTVGFVRNLAATARTLAIEKSSVEKELNESIARVKDLEKEIASKQTKSVGDLQKQVNDLTEKNVSLTAENERVQKEISALNQKMEELNAQIAGHDAELKTMIGTLEEKQTDLDAATSANKELIAQGENNKTLIAGQKLANDYLSTQLETMKTEFAALSYTNATLLSDLETKKTVEIDNAALIAKIAEIEGSLLSKEANIVSIQAKMDNKIKQIENQYKIENAKAKIFHDMEKDLMKQLHDAAIEKQISEIAENSTKSTAELQVEMSKLREEYNKALETLEQNKGELAELENTHALVLSKVNVENEELEAAKRVCEEQKTACEEAKRLCDDKTAELEAANKVCEEQKNDLQLANNAMKGILDQNNARITEIDDQIKKLNAEKIILQQTNSEQANNHAEQIAALKEEKLGIEQQNENLNKTLTSLSAEHETLKSELGKLKETYDSSTKELLDAKASNETTAADLESLIAKQKAEIANAQEKEKELNKRFAIDACLIDNSIAFLKWTAWNDAKEYFIGKYGNDKVDQVVELQSQIDAIGTSTTLDGLMGSFGMLKQLLLPSDSNNSSVEPECMKNLTDLIIKFLQSQKEIEKLYSSKQTTDEELKNEKDKYDELSNDYEKTKESISLFEGKIEATKGENLDLSVEKEALQKQLNDLQKQLIEKNENLDASQKEEMTKLLDEKISANITILDLNNELDKIKEELEEKQTNLNIAIKSLDDRERQFAELNSEIETQKSTVSQLKGEVDAITNANIALSKTVEEKEESNIGLLQKLQGANIKIGEITAELEELKKQNEKDIDDSVEAIKDEEERNNSLQAEIDANQLNLDALTSANEANKKEIDTLASDKAANQEKIDALTRTDTENQEKMQTLSRIINTLTGELRANEIKIETLKGELDAQTQKLALMNTQLQDLKTNKYEMETALFNLQSANEAQKLEHDREIIKAKEDYDNALSAAKAEAGTASKIDLDRQLAEAKVELDRQLLEAKTDLDRQLEEAKAELKIKLADEANANLEKQLEEAKTECEQKIKELQNRELKLAKELLFLKLQLDLKTQQASNFKYTYTPSTPTIVDKPRIKRDKITLLGGSNKSKIFMKGGASDYVNYDDDAELVVVFDKTDYSTIGQYPVPANDDDYVVHCTEKEIKDYNNRTQDLKAEIESLKKELENLKNSASTMTTPICSFVNKMAHGASASASTDANAKLMNINKFLLERIANMTNQKIVSTLNNASKQKIADLTAIIDTNEATIAGMKAEIYTMKSTVSAGSGPIGGTIGGPSGGIGGGTIGGPSGGLISGLISGPIGGPIGGLISGPSGGIGATNTLAGYVKPNIAFVPGNK